MKQYEGFTYEEACDFAREHNATNWKQGTAKPKKDKDMKKGWVVAVDIDDYSKKNRF